MEQLPCPISEWARSAPNQTALLSDTCTYSYSALERAIAALYHNLKQIGVQEQEHIAFIAKNDLATILLFFALLRLRAIACPLSPRTPKPEIARQLTELQASLLDPTTLLHPSSIRRSAPPLLSMHSPATFLFTSGSSAAPKIACHTIANHYYNALGALSPLQLEESSRWLLCLPLFHVSGIAILFRCFQKGATVVVSQHPLPEAISHHTITHLSLVPTQLQRLNIQSPSSLKRILLGGAPLSPTLLKHSSHLPILPTYGMTEMSSIITLAGKQLPFREIKIEKDAEIWVKGETLFLGYWDSLTKTIVKPDTTCDGWFPTKDLGRMHAEGDLEWIGRKDRLFISGGENIQPEEIEQALCTIAGIRQAVVVPIADPEYGYRPICFIEDATGTHTLTSIKKELEPLLASFKHPIRMLPFPTDTGFKSTLKMFQELLSGHQG